MYSLSLEHISLDEFKETITSVEPLPGRRVLLTDLTAVIDRLKQKGIRNLAELQHLLCSKQRYPDAARELGVASEYLVVLNREINGYVSKPIPLSKLGVFSQKALKALEDAGLKSTLRLYEDCLTKAARRDLAKRFRLPEEQLAEALELIELLRINGVGPVYAKILREMGIRNSADYLATDSREILRRFQRINQESAYTKAKLGLKDVEYCKRFCKKLDADIQW